MQQVCSRQLADLAEIYRDDVELVSVERPTDGTNSGWCTQLFERRQVVQRQWNQKAGDLMAIRNSLEADLPAEGLDALCTELELASDVLTELLGCARIGFRVVTLNRPMCPRFHVDQVQARLLITIRGPGTEWIPSNHVDRSAFADRNNQQPPIQTGERIKQFEAGHWALLKGGAWNDDFRGVVHRSPQSDRPRLLVSVDPIADAA